MTRVFTGPLLDSSFSPSCSPKAVKIEGPELWPLFDALFKDPSSGDHSSARSYRPSIPVLSTTMRPASRLRMLVNVSASRAIVMPEAFRCPRLEDVPELPEESVDGVSFDPPFA